jgi:hypothetical protein
MAGIFWSSLVLYCSNHRLPPTVRRTCSPRKGCVLFLFPLGLPCTHTDDIRLHAAGCMFVILLRVSQLSRRLSYFCPAPATPLNGVGRCDWAVRWLESGAIVCHSGLVAVGPASHCQLATQSEPARQAARPAARPAGRQAGRQAGSQAGSQAARQAARQARGTALSGMRLSFATRTCLSKRIYFDILFNLSVSLRRRERRRNGWLC